MKLLKRKNIDDAKWDNCICKSPNGLIYGLTWFLDGLVGQWQGLVWEKDGVYEAVFPIPVKRKFGLKYVYPPFFIQQLGLFSTLENKEDDALGYLKKHYKFVELNLNYSSSVGEERKNLILNLTTDYEQIKSEFSSNHKRNIKKSNALNLKVRDVSINKVIGLFRSDRGALLDTYKEEDYASFEQLILDGVNNSSAVVKGVYDGEMLICGGVFVKFKNRVTFLFSGNSAHGKKSGALFFLLNEMIKKYSNSGYVFDFEGSQNEGLARFYLGFGAVEQNYKFYKHNNLPSILKKFKK